MTRAGYVALIGRPNVGKSTLLNCLLQHKVSITSAKPQTTRHAIIGIRTLADTQIVYVDTPGLHLGSKRAINRYMNRTAGNALSYVDVVVWLIEALRWTDEENAVLDRLAAFSGPVIAALNKVDRFQDKRRLLPFINAIAKRRRFSHIIPLSARRGDNVGVLQQQLCALLPESEFFYSKEQISTASQRFMIAEIIREKLTRYLRDELPYALTVEVETMCDEKDVLHIGAVVWVERPGQKGIVIGHKGAALKTIGAQARREMEQAFGRKVFLQTWVKVRQGWSDDERALQSFGYHDDML